mmetsp:Transcript_3625/g.7519  ORF Transcript_3625/g.7519 Transcript_3625/m.7519 type:complete len:203 (+) Transcript_3625:149-757(+)
MYGSSGVTIGSAFFHAVQRWLVYRRPNEDATTIFRQCIIPLQKCLQRQHASMARFIIGQSPQGGIVHLRRRGVANSSATAVHGSSMATQGRLPFPESITATSFFGWFHPTTRATGLFQCLVLSISTSQYYAHGRKCHSGLEYEARGQDRWQRWLPIQLLVHRTSDSEITLGRGTGRFDHEPSITTLSKNTTINQHLSFHNCH